MAIICLELQNVSGPLNALEIYFHSTPAPLHCELLDAAKKAVPQTPAAVSILSPPPYWLALPYDSTLRLRGSVSGYGIPQEGGRPLQLESGFWMIPNSPASDLYLPAIALWLQSWRPAGRVAELGSSEKEWQKNGRQGNEAMHQTLSFSCQMVIQSLGSPQ